MTSPASFNTPIRAITYAMRDAGLLQEGDDPNSDQIAEYINRLNDLINYLQTQGLKLWLISDTPIPLTQGVTQYTMGPGGTVSMAKPMRGISAYYNNLSVPTAPVRVPVTIISWADWVTLSTIKTQGPVTQVFLDKQQSQININCWNTPDLYTATNGTLQIQVQQQVQNFTGLTDTMNFPIEWFMVLRWGLADELASGQPAAVQQRCQQRFSAFKTALEDWDVEDASTFFKPDSRGGQSSSRFK